MITDGFLYELKTSKYAIDTTLSPADQRALRMSFMFEVVVYPFRFLLVPISFYLKYRRIKASRKAQK